MKVAALFLLGAALAGAQTFEWWQSTDAPLLRRDRLSMVLHTQFRVRNHFHDVFQGRFGPIARISLSRGWTLVAGYYFGEAEAPAEWRNNHRTFGGVERGFGFSKGVLSIRTLAEHHFGGGNPQDRRFRQQVVWTLRAPFSPYAGTETFFDRYGFMIQRMQTGVRKSLTSGFVLDVGYIYDIRQERAGGHRHVFHTAIRPRKRES